MNFIIIFYSKNSFIILGASVIEAGTSESYKNNKAKLYWHGIGFLNYEMPPDIILQVKSGLKITCLYFRILFLLRIEYINVCNGGNSELDTEPATLPLHFYSHQTT